MERPFFTWLALALALVLAAPVVAAAADAELAEIDEQINQMKQDHGARIDSSRGRLRLTSSACQGSALPQRIRVDSTDGARVGDPGHNLVGKNWSGEPGNISTDGEKTSS